MSHAKMKHADWVAQYKRVFVGQSGEKLQELGPKHSDEQAASQFAQFIKLVDQSETLKDPDGIEITKDELKLKDRSTSADATYIRNQWNNQKSTSVALWDAYAKVVGNMKARENPSGLSDDQVHLRMLQLLWKEKETERIAKARKHTAGRGPNKTDPPATAEAPGTPAAPTAEAPQAGTPPAPTLEANTLLMLINLDGLPESAKDVEQGSFFRLKSVLHTSMGDKFTVITLENTPQEHVGVPATCVEVVMEHQPATAMLPETAAPVAAPGVMPGAPSAPSPKKPPAQKFKDQIGFYPDTYEAATKWWLPMDWTAWMTLWHPKKHNVNPMLQYCRGEKAKMRSQTEKADDAKKRKNSAGPPKRLQHKLIGQFMVTVVARKCCSNRIILHAHKNLMLCCVRVSAEKLIMS